MMISDMHMKSNHGLERYHLKYIRHLSYWKTTRPRSTWLIFDNPLFDQFGNIEPTSFDFFFLEFSSIVSFFRSSRFEQSMSF